MEVLNARSKIVNFEIINSHAVIGNYHQKYKFIRIIPAENFELFLF